MFLNAPFENWRIFASTSTSISKVKKMWCILITLSQSTSIIFTKYLQVVLQRTRKQECKRIWPCDLKAFPSHEKGEKERLILKEKIYIYIETWNSDLDVVTLFNFFSLLPKLLKREEYHWYKMPRWHSTYDLHQNTKTIIASSILTRPAQKGNVLSSAWVTIMFVGTLLVLFQFFRRYTLTWPIN